MNNPTHDGDQGDSTDWTEDHCAPGDGYYMAFHGRTRAELGTRWFDRGDRFGCWPEPPYCDVLWTGPVTPGHDGRSEEPRRVADNAAVAD